MSEIVALLKWWRKLEHEPRAATVAALAELARMKTIEDLKNSPHYERPLPQVTWKVRPYVVDEDLD